MGSRNVEFTVWKKDADLVLTSLGDFGFFTFADFDDETFTQTDPDDPDGTPYPGLEAGATITPPIAAQFAVPEMDVTAPLTINTSRLWDRDYVKMEVDFKASHVTSSIPSGFLDVQFFPAVKGHYDTFEWGFGDGNKSSNSEPFHRYRQFGDENEDKYFTVTLKVSGPSGVAEKVKVGYIKLIGKA